MFKNISINLRMPICKCEKENLSWNITPGPGLQVTCKDCAISFNIPNKEFKACFKFSDEMYPEDEKKKAKEAVEKDTSIVYGFDKEKKE